MVYVLVREISYPNYSDKGRSSNEHYPLISVLPLKLGSE